MGKVNRRESMNIKLSSHYSHSVADEIPNATEYQPSSLEINFLFLFDMYCSEMYATVGQTLSINTALLQSIL